VATVKTAVSLPEAVFERIDDLARTLQLSRSAVVTRALEEFIQRQENDRLRAQFDAAHADGLDEDEQRLLKGWRRVYRQRLEAEAEVW
jgi:predicted transcriptional regulator